MAIKDFNYNEFAKSLAEQAQNLVPNDISKEVKEYLISTLENFTKLAGEALCNDDTYSFDGDMVMFISQIIAEWTFHKCVDLAHSAVPMKYWDDILQKIAFTIFEVAKQGYKQKISEDQLLHAVEHHVHKVWKSQMEDLLKSRVITEEEAKTANELSNIDNMAKYVHDKRKGESEKTEENYSDACEEDNDDFEMTEIDIESDWRSEGDNTDSNNEIDYEEKTENEEIKEINEQEMKKQCEQVEDFQNIGIISGLFNLMKVVGRAAVSVAIAFLKIGLVVGVIWGIIKLYGYLKEPSLAPAFVQNHSGALTAILSIYIIAVLIQTLKIFVNIDVQSQLNQLEKVRQNMHDLVNPDKMYERLGVDMVCIQVGEGLLEIADPEKEGDLLAKLAALRQRMTDKLGYIIPNFRIQDSSELEANEYALLIRDNIVASGFVYPGKYMVIADDWDSLKKDIPEDAIVGIDPTYQTQAYWVSKKDAESEKSVTATEPVDVIITHVEETLIKHVDSVLTILDVHKLIELVKSDNPTLIDILVPNLLSLADLRRIFVNLIREKVSIKDIMFVFERLCDYARHSQIPDVLSERLRCALGRQICLNNVEKDKVLYAINFSKKREKLLEEKVERNEMGAFFSLEPEQVQGLVELTAMTLMKAHHDIGEQPVILCSPKIRLPLYQLLVQHIPTIVVISYSELITDIHVEVIETISDDTENVEEGK